MALTRHPDLAVREWALDRLLNIVPMRGAMRAIELLGQGVSMPWNLVLDRVRQLGRRDLGLALLQRWQKLFGTAACETAIEVFEASGTVEVLPALRERAGRRSDGVNTQTATFEVIGALGDAGDRALLRRFVRDWELNPCARAGALRGLLSLRNPEDVGWAMRGNCPVQYDGGSLLDHVLISCLDLKERYFAITCGWGPLAEARTPGDAVRGALDLDELPLSTTCLRRLLVSVPGSASWFRALLDEVIRLTRARGDDVVGWARRSAGAVPPAGYRWWAVATLELLRAAMELPRDRDVATVALLATAELALDEDDEAQLAAATDVDSALIALCGSRRDRVLPGVVARVAAMGPRVVPALRAALRRATRVEPRRRLVTALFRIELDHPGSIAQAAPELAAVPGDETGTLTELVVWALLSVGPSVVSVLRDAPPDRARSYIAARTLAELGTPEAADRLAELVAGEPDERGYRRDLLAQSADPRFLEQLAAAWEPRNVRLAEALCVMVEVHGLQHPHLPRWRAARLQEELASREGLRASMVRSPQPDGSYD